MKKNTISVIIPVYNCDRYINDCVESIEKQEGIDLEIILVNDGSTDNSAEKCKAIAKSFSNIIYIEQENSGAASARNTGLDRASGEFVSFIDADDGIKPDYFKRLLDSMSADIDVVCCSYSIIGSSKEEDMFYGHIYASNNTEKEVFLLQLLDYTYGHEKESVTAIGVPWGKLIRKQVLDESGIRFDTRLRRMQDNVFIMELFYAAKSIVYIPDHLYLYRIDHIKSYGTLSYSPENYIGVLNKRDEFFKSHTNIINSKVEQFIFYEKVNYLMMSIHYIIAKTNDKDKALAAIRLLCSNEVYQMILERKVPRKLSKKQKIQCQLIKKQHYLLIYYIYKFKYRI